MASSSSLEREVFDFVAEFCSFPRQNLRRETRLQQDIGVDGDDGDDLLIAFSKRFGVSLDTFYTLNYFNNEGVSIFDLARLICQLLGFCQIPDEKMPITIDDLILSAENKKLLLKVRSPAKIERATQS
jgi:hypothetical protein